MNSFSRRWDVLSIASLAGATALTAAVWDKLPARVPTHFNLHGQVDGWMDRAVGGWLLLGIALLTFVVVRFGARILPHGARERLEASPVGVLAFLTTELFVVLQAIVLWAALHPADSMARPLATSLALYWLVLALVMPRVRRNPFVGVRTAWTLASDENWARTHRFASFAFAIGGIVALVAALASAHAIAILAVLASALAPVVFSFVVAHRLPPA